MLWMYPTYIRLDALLSTPLMRIQCSPDCVGLAVSHRTVGVRDVMRGFEKMMTRHDVLYGKGWWRRLDMGGAHAAPLAPYGSDIGILHRDVMHNPQPVI